MFLVEDDRYIYSANVVCANQNIKKSGYSSLKQNPFVQKRKTNLLESHCRTKTPRRNKIARTTRKAGRCDKISAIDMQEGLIWCLAMKKSPSGDRKNDSLPPAAWR